MVKQMKIKSLLILVAISMSGFNSLYAAGNCVAEKARFKELYIALQQSLNYEGKDAYIDNGVLKLKVHDPNSPYEGKVFEAALNKEYSLALKKVGAIYQASKFENFEKSNPALVEFIKAIDGDDKAIAEYVKQNKVDQVIDQLAEASKKKFGEGKNAARITNNDKYLLKKLLTHAQDRICSVSKFEEREQKTGKQTKDNNFSADELNRVRNAPLNRLIHSIKNGKLTADSDLKMEELKDSEMAITQAVAKNLQAIKDWKSKNAKCLNDIANPAFIQSGVQICNYNQFIKALDKGNEDNLEAVLHFINSNEKFLKNPAAKAETAYDDLKLEAAIDQAFNGVGKREACPVVRKKDSKIFINNLPFTEKGGFNKTGLNITCLKGKSKLDQALCEKSVEFVSNSTGEGIELRLKQSGSLQLNVESKSDCSGDNPPVSLEADKTDEECEALGKKLSPDKKSCVVKPNLNLKNNLPKITVDAAYCNEEGTRIGSPKPLIPNPDKASAEKCIPAITQEDCDEQGKKEGKKYTLNIEKNKCETDSSTPVEKPKTAADCTKEEVFINNKCESKRKSEECEKLTTDNKDGKKYKLDESKNSCELVEEKAPEKKTEEEQCIEKNSKWIDNPEDGEVRRTRYEWDSKAKECKDKQEKKSGPSESEEEGPNRASPRTWAPTAAPQRFTPIQVPSRQMYILPGMP
jgi:hypothetical protein